MNAVLAFLVSRWFLSFVGIALLAVLVWFFGPFLEFLESWVAALVRDRGDAADLGRRQSAARLAPPPPRGRAGRRRSPQPRPIRP